MTMIANYFGYETDIASMRRRFGLSARGATLQDLISIADKIGLECRAVRLELSELHLLSSAAILHWNLNHFVVAERSWRGRILLHDPELGTRWINVESASPHFTGIALLFEPKQRLEPMRDRTPIRLSDLWGRLRHTKKTIAQAIALSAIVQLSALILPFFSQIAIDSVLPTGDSQLLGALATCFGALAVVNGFSLLMRSNVLSAAAASMGLGLGSHVGRRLLRLPGEWFEKRQVGDILSRFQSIMPVQLAMTEGALAALLDGLLAIVSLIAMSLYSSTLALVATVATAAYIAAKALTFHLAKDAQREAIVARAREQGSLIESIRGIATLRLFNKEMHRFSVWNNRLVETANASFKAARIDNFQKFAKELIFGIDNVLFMFFAIRAAMSGTLTLGMIVAFSAYKLQFRERAASFVDQTSTLRMLRLHLDRLADIVQTEEDQSFSDQAADRRLEGGVELLNVSYRYGSGDDFVLKGINLRVSAGEHLAITGRSGGGKSTLAKLVLGLLEPSSGEVRIDGVDSRHFGYRNFRGQAAAVLQDDVLFAGSLADNISLFDPNPDPSWLERVTKLAAIHEDIEAMPMRFDTLVGDMGSSLSGGQKQRILLARALYVRPRFLLIDEGTSHLDPANEGAINKSVAELGITRVVIAHRESTILAADRILSLENGALRDETLFWRSKAVLNSKTHGPSPA